MKGINCLLPISCTFISSPCSGGSARLTVSDWTTDAEPGGPVGRELMFNFIEIQPYLAE